MGYKIRSTTHSKYYVAVLLLASISSHLASLASHAYSSQGIQVSFVALTHQRLVAAIVTSSNLRNSSFESCLCLRLIVGARLCLEFVSSSDWMSKIHTCESLPSVLELSDLRIADLLLLFFWPGFPL